MISYVKGQLAEKTDELIVVENNGIGYSVRIAISMLDRLPSIGETVKIYTYMHVREDAMLLYGFLNKSEMDVFKLLIAVSGIGPKSALGLLSIMSPEDFRLAVISGDSKTIAKANGIGIKSAQRIILDLKDKVDITDIFSKDEETYANTESIPNNSRLGDAIEALVALGYSPTQASKAVRKVEIIDDMDSEDILKVALKELVVHR